MKVIGAGFGRSGTASMYLALEQLGYRTYHMVEAMPRRDHTQAWGALWDKTGHVDDVLDLVAAAGFNASMDFPVCIAYKDLMRRNPDAKVILTLRDSGEKWAASFLDTIALNTDWMSKAPFTVLTPGLGAMHKWMYTEAGMSLDEITWRPSLDSATMAYNTWADEVQRHVPKQQLLVFRVGDGWQPLCKFLNVDHCPEGSFPRAPNDRVFMQRMVLFGDFVTQWWFALWPSCLLICLAAALICTRCSCGPQKYKSS